VLSTGKEHVALGCGTTHAAPFAVVLDRDEQQRIAEPPLRTAAIGITLIRDYN
jgi:hypothetical protein